MNNTQIETGTGMTILHDRTPITSIFLAVLVSLVSPHLIHAQGWEQVYPDYEVNPIYDIHRWAGDTLYAGGANGTLLQSNDAGETWNTIRIDTQMDEFYAITRFRDELFLSGLPNVWNFTSSWRPKVSLCLLYSYNPYSGSLRDLSVKRERPIYNSFPPIVQSTNDDVYLSEVYGNDSVWVLRRSSDGGVTWKSATAPDLSVSMQIVTDSIIIYLSRRSQLSEPQYLYRTTNNGVSWTRISGISFSTITNASFGSFKSAGSLVVYLGAGTKVFRSADSGATWAETSAIPWNSINNSAVKTVAVSSEDSIYVLGVEGDVYSSFDAGASWTLLRSPDPQVTATDMIVFGNGQIIISTLEGIFYKSGDGGVTWTTLLLNEIKDISSIHFFDSANGIVIATDIANNRAIYTTHDGGAAWTRMNGDYSHASGKSMAAFISFDEFYAYTLDRVDSTTVFTLWRTTDRGDSWEYVHESVIGFGAKGVHQFHASGDVYTFTTHEFTELIQRAWYSYDRGKSWAFAGNTDAAFHSIKIRSVLTAGNALEHYGLRFPPKYGEPRVFKSTDSCKTWALVYSPSSSVDVTVEDLFIQDEKNIVLRVLPANSSMKVRYMSSSDGGQSWSNVFESATKPIIDVITSPYRYAMYGNIYLTKHDGMWDANATVQLAKNTRSAVYPVYHFLDRDHGWLASNQTICRTTTGGVDWIEQPFTVREDAAISSIYPNPVTAGQQVTVSIIPPQSPHTSQLSTGAVGGRNAPLRVIVYDLLGRAVATLYNGPAETGTRTLTWQPAATLPAGMYVVRMALGEKVWAKQVALVK